MSFNHASADWTAAASFVSLASAVPEIVHSNQQVSALARRIEVTRSESMPEHLTMGEFGAPQNARWRDRSGASGPVPEVTSVLVTPGTRALLEASLRCRHELRHHFPRVFSRPPGRGTDHRAAGRRVYGR